MAIRLSEQDVATIDQRAAEAGLSPSEMMRRMLAYAAAHMPAGWRAT